VDTNDTGSAKYLSKFCCQSVVILQAVCLLGLLL